ncbi:MAG: hypothetical protein CM1200mP38_5770 [Dehalococcoidia bacterium]|nr:MAG: hypothetical protein CM1200mP38_5770 [Dehalococcoidia bacterium]
MIISGPAEESSQEYQNFQKLFLFSSEKDYTIDEKHQTRWSTVEGFNLWKIF